MRMLRTVLLSTAALAAAGLPAQEPVAPKERPAQQGEKQPGKNVTQWIEELGSESYRARLDAERALRELGDAAVAELRKAAEDSDDAEVQWRARRLLRQIERGGQSTLEERRPRPEGDDRQGEAGARRGPFVWGTEPDVRRHFESLFERFERDFGIDVPRARFFNDEFFQDLQQQMKAGTSRSQAMSMQIGPDGAVRVEVEEKGEDGKTEKKVYEAPDMESFRAKYPDVLRRSGLGMGFLRGGGYFLGQPDVQWRTFGGDPQRVFELDERSGPGWRVLTPRRSAHQDPEQDEFGLVPLEPQAPPAGKRLGVTIRTEFPAGVREYLRLGEDEGLWVETVQEGSLAEALGLQPGDIVVRIGERSIGSPQDVQQALGAIAKGETVAVTFVRKGAEKTATAAKTEAVEDGAGEEARKAEADKADKAAKAGGDKARKTGGDDQSIR